MIDAARTRPGAQNVIWIHGTAADVPAGAADLVVMMGHVAQYFVSDEEWTTVLVHARRMLREGGHLAFETRNPDRGWPQRWTKERTRATYPHPDGGTFDAWVQSVAVEGSTESFTETHVGHTVLPDGTHLSYAETLRFRSEAEVCTSLAAAGFAAVTIWGDWDSSPVSADRDELIVLSDADPSTPLTGNAYSVQG